MLPHFFHEYRVRKRNNKVNRPDKKKLPKRNTVESVRSHLKLYILRNSKLKFDITKDMDFPKFGEFWKGYIKTLKAKGYGDTKHNPEISHEHLQKINEFLVIMHKVIIGKPFLLDETKDPPTKTLNPEYAELLKQIPKVYDKKTGNGNTIIANILIKKILRKYNF